MLCIRFPELIPLKTGNMYPLTIVSPSPTTLWESTLYV